jgi:hypothetical protein
MCYLVYGSNDSAISLRNLLAFTPALSQDRFHPVHYAYVRRGTIDGMRWLASLHTVTQLRYAIA